MSTFRRWTRCLLRIVLMDRGSNILYFCSWCIFLFFYRTYFTLLGFTGSHANRHLESGESLRAPWMTFTTSICHIIADTRGLVMIPVCFLRSHFAGVALTFFCLIRSIHVLLLQLKSLSTNNNGRHHLSSDICGSSGVGGDDANARMVGRDFSLLSLTRSCNMIMMTGSLKFFCPLAATLVHDRIARALLNNSSAENARRVRGCSAKMC